MRPWPELDLALRAARDAFAAVGYTETVWVDVVGPLDEIGCCHGVGRSPFHLPADAAGSINTVDHGMGLSLTLVAVVKQGQAGKPILHPCASALFHELALHGWTLRTKDNLNTDHTDPEARRLETDMISRCAAFRKAEPTATIFHVPGRGAVLADLRPRPVDAEADDLRQP